jgi:hypothetical protein
VGCGGWVATAGELIKFTAGVRDHRIIDRHLTERMFREQLGCYEYVGIYGKYYDHNGWLHTHPDHCRKARRPAAPVTFPAKDIALANGAGVRRVLGGLGGFCEVGCSCKGNGCKGGSYLFGV